MGVLGSPYGGELNDTSVHKFIVLLKLLDY